MKTSINTGGEFYLADFGYFSMSVYKYFDMCLELYILCNCRITSTLWHVCVELVKWVNVGVANSVKFEYCSWKET